MSQEARERSMAAFKAGKRDVLIATDVAARGIDVDDVTHVINHTIPDDEKTYLHRAGRTGRAGKTGIAVTFVDWDDLHKWALINRALEFGQPEPTETYSSSPHLFSDLDIPAGTKGRIATAPKTQTVKTQDARAAARTRSGCRGRGRRRGRHAPPSPPSRRRRAPSARPSPRDRMPAPPTSARRPRLEDAAPTAPARTTARGKEHHDGKPAPAPSPPSSRRLASAAHRRRRLSRDLPGRARHRARLGGVRPRHPPARDQAIRGSGRFGVDPS